MAIRVVRLGSPRVAGEGMRIGTVRRPPRGVRKEEYAKLDYFDVWLPQIAPSAELVKWIQTHSDSPQGWARFETLYRRELSSPDSRHLIELLAALSSGADFSIGCYCEDEAKCHRSILGRVLAECGAKIA